MSRAIALADTAGAAGEVPVGAVIVDFPFGCRYRIATVQEFSARVIACILSFKYTIKLS